MPGAQQRVQAFLDERRNARTDVIIRYNDQDLLASDLRSLLAMLPPPLGSMNKPERPGEHGYLLGGSPPQPCRLPEGHAGHCSEKRPTCECYHDCRDCSLNGVWHVHPGEPCLVHPDAPGDR